MTVTTEREIPWRATSSPLRKKNYCRERHTGKHPKQGEVFIYCTKGRMALILLP